MENLEANRQKAKHILEAVLFTMGDSVEISRLAEVIEETPKTTRTLLTEMAEEYKVQERGLALLFLENAVQLSTTPEMTEYLIKIAAAPRKYTLSDAAMETLSIVAYKQPVTRLDVEKIRGVKCEHAINRLMDLDLIREVGRLDAPGRPILFGTTEQFLRSFGVSSIEDLPRLSPVQMEEFKEQAEAEATQTVDI